MSHTDRVKVMPSGFEITAKTEACPIAAYENEEKKYTACSSTPR